MENRVLVVDDEKIIVKGLKFSLEQEGWRVDCAYDGEEALELVGKNNYSIILLDLMLPKLSGTEVCQQIRETSNVPIIMLTAKSDDMDKIMGLEYGADDYITKPFNILEVKARMKAIMRRTTSTKKTERREIVSGDLRLLQDGKRVFVKDNEIKVTGKEYDLLKLLVENVNRVYSREELLRTVWGADYPGDVRTVDVHVRRLREKIESNPGEPLYVQTKWGSGYYYKER